MSLTRGFTDLSPGRHSMRTLAYLSFGIFVLLMVTACSATKVVNKPQDIRADSESNIVLMSYDIAIIGSDPDRNYHISNHLSFRCLNTSTGKEADCFLIPVSRGKKDMNGLSLGVFQADAAKPYKMDFGDYVLQSVHFQVQIGVETTFQCTTGKKGKTICTPVDTPIYASGRAELPQPVAFRVSPGRGCVVGHFKIRMQGDDLIEFEQTPAIENPAQRVSAGVRTAVQNHVSGSCRSS